MTKSHRAEYLRPGPHTAGIRNMILCYNGHYESNAGIWSKEDFIPYVSYLNEQHEPQEWLFDGALFLAKWSHAFHGYEESHDAPSDYADWLWYLDKTFGESGDLVKLNEAVSEVGDKLGDSEHRMKVAIMIPYPAANQQSFGQLEQMAGEPLCFDHSIVSPEQAYRNKQAAVDWYIQELMRRWDLAELPRLELCALYWMNEAVHESIPYENELVAWTGEQVHKLDLKYFWIPYFHASQYDNWEKFGFDAAVKQPNHFFTDTGEERIKLAAEMAKEAGMGVEMEVDSRVFDVNGPFRQKYFNYLNGGLAYGYAGDVFRGYYQDVKLLAQAAYSQDPGKREVYDWMYQFIKGHYQIKE